LKKLGAALVCAVFCLHLQGVQLPVVLGSTVTFSILAAAAVTNSGPTIVNGNLGISPMPLSFVTGFPPGTVAPGFQIYATTPGPAATAQIDLTTAYNDAATSHRDGDVPTTLSGDLSGLTLAPGLYNSTSTLSLGQTGNGILIFNGGGNPNSVWVIQVGSGLTTFTGSQMILAGGASAANIFWQVGSSATLGTNSTFYGTILAMASITLGTGAALDGRALARTGAVTLLDNTMTEPGSPTTGGPAGALAVTCPNSAAQVGITYNSLVVATGGTPPYAYSIPPGTLPAGLSLNTTTGAVTGIPGGLGTSTFTVTATDSAAGSISNSCSIATSNQPSTVPIPSSLILVLIGLACAVLYGSRERIMRLAGRS
jgi:hypothetical protein